MFQPHGPVTVRARGRAASKCTSQEEGESKHSAAAEVQQTPACQQQDDDELPLARVRDDALARKACLSFAYCYLIKNLVHVGHFYSITLNHLLKYLQLLNAEVNI